MAGVPEMDSGSDRKSVATHGSAHSCGQPFDSAPVTHDAVPEAKAYAGGEPAPECGGETGISPRDGTGNTQKPVAWMVQNDDGERWLCHNHPAAAKYGLKCFPLFAKPQPTLTDAEREAVEWCLSLPILDCDVVRMMPLRNLLERMK